MKTFIKICLLFALFMLINMMTEKQILSMILSGIVCIYWDKE
jgi:hypothetical protein